LLVAAASARAQAVKLESGWQFLPDPSGELTIGHVSSVGGWRDVRVGLSWNAQFEDMRDYMGVAWYRLRFEAPELRAGRAAALRFDAVDYFCDVFINGQSHGSHEGGYLPFTVYTSSLRPGMNELLVRVVDPPMDERENRARFPEMLYKEIPHGKQNWYVQTGGIWQPVWLETIPQRFIGHVHVTPRTNGDFHLELSLRSSEGREGPPPLVNLSITVRDPEGRAVYTRNLLTTTAELHTFSGRVPSPRLWSPESPSLYTVEVDLFPSQGGGGQLIVDGPPDHSVRERFGFRSFEARDGKFYLNGEPFYMLSALDQDFYPETIYTAPSEDYIRDQMLKAKRLGLNLLRCHIKVCEPAYLKVADEVGMLVWNEVPSWNDFNHYSKKAAERAHETFRQMVGRDWNHPSLVIQSLINESWGADLKQAEQRLWLRYAYESAKYLTERRGTLIVDNSACCDNFHVRTDIDDFHRYNSIPDYHADFDRWVADFATRPRWSFSPHGDALRTNREPLVVSEFGNWGLPKLPVDLPWWFARDFGGREVTRPAGVHERFGEFQLSTVFRDYDALAEATQWHQFRSLKHEIEEIRRHASLQGYVITEFTDLNWEANGLLDMWRNPKVYASELAKIQQPDVILARPHKRNFTSGESAELEVSFSHYGTKRLDEIKTKYWFESGKGSAAAGHYKLSGGPGSVKKLFPFRLTAPSVEKPRRERLLMEVRAVDGSLVAENSCDVFIYPQPSKRTAALFFQGEPKGSDELANWNALRRAAAAGGYGVVKDRRKVTPATLLVATSVDTQVERHLRGGGRAIILAGSKDAFPSNSRFKVVPREGDLDGNWVTNFNWVRKDAAPFDAVATDSLLGFEGTSAVPRFVIQGVPGESYGDVLSGIFYGWINYNAALMVRMRAGEGRLLATTFRFGEYGRDPFSTHLFDALVRHVAAPGFAPRLEWSAAKSK
jgi:beta-galactosidase/beta-glucuronidase